MKEESHIHMIAWDHFNLLTSDTSFISICQHITDEVSMNIYMNIWPQNTLYNDNEHIISTLNELMLT